MDVTLIRLPASNAHLLTGPTGDRVLVDAGSAAAVRRLRAELVRHGVDDPRRLRAVVLTHGHADHAGGARALVGPDVPVVVGAADAAMLEAGHNPPLVPTNLTARLIRRYVDTAFAPYSADVLVGDGLDLSAFGMDADAIAAPAHTAGSLVVASRGGAHLLAGDLVRGGHLGGTFRPQLPLPHYYSEDLVRDAEVLGRLLRAHRPTHLHVGHGGPVDVTAATRLAHHVAGAGTVAS